MDTRWQCFLPGIPKIIILFLCTVKIIKVSLWIIQDKSPEGIATLLPNRQSPCDALHHFEFKSGNGGLWQIQLKSTLDWLNNGGIEKAREFFQIFSVSSSLIVWCTSCKNVDKRSPSCCFFQVSVIYRQHQSSSEFRTFSSITFSLWQEVSSRGLSSLWL